MPKIGYGSAQKTKHVCPDGFKKLLVHNVKVSFVCLKPILIVPLSKTLSNAFYHSLPV
jgi:hypothetical protein